MVLLVPEGMKSATLHTLANIPIFKAAIRKRQFGKGTLDGRGVLK